MSLHQSGFSALSVGSEANFGHALALVGSEQRLAAYERLAVWFDRPAVAQQAARLLQEQRPFRKENMCIVSPREDANELLMAGVLASTVESFLVSSA